MPRDLIGLDSMMLITFLKPVVYSFVCLSVLVLYIGLFLAFLHRLRIARRVAGLQHQYWLMQEEIGRMADLAAAFTVWVANIEHELDVDFYPRNARNMSGNKDSGACYGREFKQIRPRDPDLNDDE
jgi:hypothetical protein